jgi:hypothetical protein
VIFSIRTPGPPVVIDPVQPILRMTHSQNGKFLFVAAADKERQSETIHAVNLERGSVLNREVDNPPTNHDRLGAFLGGNPPAGLESKQGIWVFTSHGMSYMTEDGTMGNELPLANQASAAAMLSADRNVFLLAAPTGSQNAGSLQIVNLKNGKSVTHTLTDVPIRMIRLGPSATIWLISSRGMRTVTEDGEVGDRAILLSKPPSQGGADPNAGELTIDGDVGGAVTLGADRAAVLIDNQKGGSSHRVAVLDLKAFRVETVITTMTKGEQSKIIAERWLEFLGAAAIQGAIEGTVTGATGVPYTLPSGPAALPTGLANELLAASPDGQAFYVLNTDTHKVAVVNVQAGTIVGQIPIDESTTEISVTADGKYLVCVGAGRLKYLKMIDIGASTVKN